MENFDVIIIGGGVNGVGIAQEASLQGYRTLLLEQDDLCSGVSAWSGRLAHGGLRYLEHFDFALVRESLLERERLVKNAPHLAKHVPWIMPVYKHNKRGGQLVRLGMILFDILSFDKSAPRHKFLSKKKVLEKFPTIETDGLKGGFHYWDGQIELAERLCVELALDAKAHGAIIRTHSRVERPVLSGSKVTGVAYRDLITGETHTAYAPVVYNVAGPWIDRVFTQSAELPSQPRLNGGTKGSHLIVNTFPGAPKEVVYYETRTDGRLILVIPWLGKYMLGTTDIRWEKDPGEARCDIGELEYLLSEVNALIPQAKLTIKDVLYTYSGVRPLPYEPEKNESAVTRTHILFDHKSNGADGLVTVVGGKLTTFRQLSEDAVTDLNKRFKRMNSKSLTRNRKLPGAHFHDFKTLVLVLINQGASEITAQRLAQIYGSRALEIWKIVELDKSSFEMIEESIGLTRAEVEYVLDQEFPKTLADLMARRLILAFESGHGLNVVQRIAEIAAGKLGWSTAEISRQIDGYKTWLDHLAIPDEQGPRSTHFGAKQVSESK
jgi:glycerol-3-phosphate dehydrogenase